ncbi:MAG: M10 family metallopeptidase C-terminal domain-containing protein [Candidatus Accumulibacter sp.]|nr:M10 family metallopeptidase C-terminal domain-containing protein [Candidatus Accumulibacter necessarius]
MALASWTQQQILDQLISGARWSGPTITYAFPAAASGIYGSQELSGFVGLNAAQQTQAERALQTWDDLIAPDLVRTTATTSNIEFGTSTTGVGYAHAYFPTTGSVWFSRSYADLMSPQVGQHSFMTYVHEIGHALGLDHMGDYNGSGSWTPSSYEDSGVYSVMSYFGPNMNSGSGKVAWADWVGADGRLYSPQTPMVNDVMAIQAIYGAETTTRTGDTVYGFGSNVTGSMAPIFDFTLNANPIVTIYDSGGIDTLNLSGWNTACTINLAPGSYSSGNSMTYNIAIAYTCDVENAVGGSAGDQITGNLLANRLDGGVGNDTLSGGGGNDVLVAGAGNDVLDGGEGTDSVVFSGAWGAYSYTCTNLYPTTFAFTFYGAATGTDTLRGIETFIFADVTKYASELSGAGPSPSLVSISSSAATQAEGNAGQTLFSYKVSLSAASSSVQTVNWSLSGTGSSAADPASDFSGATAGSITFQIGETEKTIQIYARGDTSVEADEHFTVTLSNPSAGLKFASSSAQGTIVNDDTSSGDDDFGSTTASAGNLAVNGSGVSGAIERAGDLDLFRVNLNAGVTYVFDLVATGSGVDPYLSLYAMTATSLSAVASNDNVRAGTSSAQITYTATSSATYYLLAQDAWTGTGSYTISAITFAGRTITGDEAANRLTGTLGDDVLYGLGGADVLSGDGGDDRLDGGTGADAMSGGNGNDIYVVDNAADSVSETSAAGGVDRIESLVSFTLGTNLENLVLTGNADSNGTGNSQSNQLTGNSGNNVLDGKAGLDTFAGGSGNDTYLLDMEGELANVTENAGQGTDTLTVLYANPLAAKSIALTGNLANIENVLLSGAGLFNVLGNGLANVLTGNALANRLDGGAGIDTLIGGAGGDTYVVDQVGDVLVETSSLASEIDTVESWVSWGLGANLENLTLLGSGNLAATGNALNNTLTGNAGANRLDGGLGADILLGGAGDDRYVVDNLGDKVYETTTRTSQFDAGGTDTVESSINWTLGNFVENLTLSGSGNLSGTGNALANTLRGNAGINVLDGKAGVDVLDGGEGSDIYLVGLASDHAAAEIADSGNVGSDEVRFAASTSGTLTLFAGDRGIERVVIGKGLGEVAVSSGTLALDVDASQVVNALSLLGNAGANVLTGTAYADTLDGGAGADRLIGGGGADTLIGGAGNDVYVVDSGDAIIEASTLASEIDRVESYVDWILGANLENLTLLGSGNLAATGNALNNTLAGNAGANRLDGGLGADILLGGAGDDRYVVDNLGDKVYETTTSQSDAGGTDTVESSINWTLGNFVENLTLTGNGNLSGTGNALANTLLGNVGINVLDGKAGVDVLDGGEGSDIYLVGLASDHAAAEIADSGNVGSDEVRFAASTSGTLTLFAGDRGIERVVIGKGLGEVAVSSGTLALDVDASRVANALSLLGNAGANVLTGTAYADTLDGSAGADRLMGGDGNDRLLGGAGNDTLTGGAGADQFVLTQALSSTANRDVLADFVSGTDTIQLSLSVFGALGVAPGDLTADQFWSGSGIRAAHDASDRIIYDTATGSLLYDADGSGSGAAVAIAVVGLVTHPSLACSDFQLIA